jgi:hypothetical protein
MWQRVGITLFMFLTFSHVFGQDKEYFFIPNNDHFDKLNLTLSATSGTCKIQPARQQDIIKIIGSESQTTLSPTFTKEIIDRVQIVDFQVHHNHQAGMSRVLSGRFFGADPCKKNNWNIHLSDNKPLNLNLNYVVGEAEVDLSGLPVENMRVVTGNANVKISFANELYNPIEMDSFFAKVDMGNLQINQINFVKAKEIVAEVGVGKMYLDFSHPHIICKTKVTAKVGAGNMEILLTENQNPILIRINNSPLCHIKIPKSFKKIDKDTYANELYFPNADHLIVFDLEVAIGQITFISN